jgi:hypothetical protein
MDKREFKESPVQQGEGESIAYKFPVPSSWGVPPITDIHVTVKRLNDLQDVTADHVTGNASATDAWITLPIIHSLRAGQKYRVEVQFSANGNSLEAFGIFEGEH